MSHSLKGNVLKKINGLFLICVVVPSLIATAYFGFIASDVYISESRFVVRSPQRKAPSLLGAALSNAGFSSSRDDAYLVNDYILSRDALSLLDKELDLRNAFGNNEIDFVSKFNGFGLDDSFEALHRHYEKHISLHIQGSSSIGTLTIRAFTPETAQRINERLLELSEELINRVNERGRQDLISSAAEEVRLAEERSLKAALALSDYRNKKGVVDPEQQATIQLEQVGRLQEELIGVKGRLAQLKSFAKDNPQIFSLQKRADTLQNAINAENRKVTGGKSSLADKAADYQRLVLNQEFADKQLASALASLEQSRNEAQRKQVYLERIVQPSIPDSAEEPRRIRSIVSTFILSLITFAILSMLLAGMREHLD